MSIRDIQVIDFVSDLVVLDNRLEGGVLKPEKIQKTDLGATMKWKIEDIEPKEERIIRYSV